MARGQLPGNLPPLLAAEPARLVDRLHLGGAVDVVREQRQLHLARLGPAAEGPPLRHGQRHLTRPHTHQVEVIRGRHPQQQPVLQQHPEPAAEHRPVPGHHHAQAHSGPLAHEALDALDDGPAVDVLEGGHEVVPPVDQQHQVGQPPRLGRLGPLLGQ